MFRNSIGITVTISKNTHPKKQLQAKTAQNPGKVLSSNGVLFDLIYSTSDVLDLIQLDQIDQQCDDPSDLLQWNEVRSDNTMELFHLIPYKIQ